MQWLHDFYSIHFILILFLLLMHNVVMFCVFFSLLLSLSPFSLFVYFSLLQIDKVQGIAHSVFFYMFFSTFCSDRIGETKWDYCGKMETIWAQYGNQSSERRHYSIDLNSSNFFLARLSFRPFRSNFPIFIRANGSIDRDILHTPTDRNRQRGVDTAKV